METLNPIEKAINAVGSASKLARKLGVKPSSITLMRKKGDIARANAVTPSEWVEITGLTKKELFPDFQD